MRIFALLVCAFTAAVSAQGPSFKADVRLVRLDVSALGRDRQPIRDVTASDVRVTERGRPLAYAFDRFLLAARTKPTLGDRTPLDRLILVAQDRARPGYYYTR
jgi:hypothetical protein